MFDTVYWTSLGDPDDGCPGVPAEDNYNAQTNPGGVRCTLADYMINVFGPRPSSAWIAPEQQVGHGFAGLPLDNVGVQYGLEALKKGLITTGAVRRPERQDRRRRHRHQPDPRAPRRPTSRRSPTPTAAAAVNSANNLDQVAIIDLRGPDPGAFHDAYRSWAIRARLEREHGTFANQVIWFGAVPLMGDPNYATEAMLAMDRWLAAVEADRGTGSLAEKIIRDRPGDVNDRCSQVDGLELVSLPGVGPVCELKEVQTRFGTPRTVAGEGVETDTNKCTLKPLRRLDYYPITFTDAQWQRLQSAFPAGVCDWGVPGVEPGRTRSRGRPTRTRAETWSTAAGRSARRRAAPAAAGPAARSTPGAADRDFRAEAQIRLTGSSFRIAPVACATA